MRMEISDEMTFLIFEERQMEMGEDRGWGGG
jgi:hypothetical protein